jgi:cell division protein ZapE
LPKSAETILARYDALASSGEIERDSAQLQAVAALDDLAAQLAAPRRFNRILGRLPFIKRKNGAPRGLYLWGDVGRGKTTLMDLFFEAAPEPAKRRAHFYAFMTETHERLHRARRNGDGAPDPVTRVAESLGQELKLLCLDELAVYDIADATILSRLFSTLFGAGVVLVATSNFAPRRLYEGGRNRDLFLPFIALLEERTKVLELSARADFRLEKSPACESFFLTCDQVSREEAQARIAGFLGSGPLAPASLRVNGRKIEAAAMQGRVACFDFTQICAVPVGSSDYLELTKRFDVVIIENAPQLAFDRRDEARRFIALIDILYEAKTKLVLTAEAEVERLFCADYGAEAQEFRRTVSRLHEMRSREYIEECRRRAKNREPDEAASPSHETTV